MKVKILRGAFQRMFGMVKYGSEDTILLLDVEKDANNPIVIHTFFLKRPIQVILVSRDLKVVDFFVMKPNRMKLIKEKDLKYIVEFYV